MMSFVHQHYLSNSNPYCLRSLSPSHFHPLLLLQTCSNQRGNLLILGKNDDTGFNAYRGCFDICEDDVSNASPRDDNESSRPSSSLPQNAINQNKKFSSGSLLPDNYLSPKSLLRMVKVDDTSEGAVVQRKGRFKVTLAYPMGPSNCTFGPVVGVPSSPLKQNFIGASILPSLQCILQQNSLQRVPVTARERELNVQVIQLQQSSKAKAGGNTGRSFVTEAKARGCSRNFISPQPLYNKPDLSLWKSSKPPTRVKLFILNFSSCFVLHFLGIPFPSFILCNCKLISILETDTHSSGIVDNI
ncbi:hypothetical protein RIF29_14269 [Crotalaria pallida]|uniref:Uncharacterized protein n=1 Tax=Crotalaria pallida TaxID=3830 RepID=A0AAN9IDL9_CROPI